MNITLNGKLRPTEPGTTLADLLATEGIGTAGTAVALNGRVVRQPQWSATTLSEGDSVLIISAAYGG